MRVSRVFFAVVALLLCLNCSAKTIMWARWNAPPNFIVDGPFLGEGILNVVEKELKKALPQYTHEEIEAGIPRILKEAEVKSPICNAGWLNTPEWGKLFYFSKPIFIIPSNGLLIKASLARELLKEKGTHSLQSILDKKSNWVLGVGRLYGEGIDDVLIKNNYQKNPKISNVTSSLLAHKMLQLGRIQYTLGYPFEAEYYNELLKSNSDKIVYIPLSDNSPFVEVVAACPKSSWGAAVIKDINKTLDDKKRLERIKQAFTRWLSPSEQKRLLPEITKFYHKNYPAI